MFRRAQTAKWLQKNGFAVLACMAIAGLWFGHMLPWQTPASSLVAERPLRRDFSLTDAKGQTVSLATYEGKWLLLFFGFTMCPDACPLALTNIATALNEMGDLSGGIQPIFITVDPERDTPDLLKEYLGYFGGNIIGLSGRPDAIADVARLYGVYYAKRPLDQGYTMDHSTALYMVAPNGIYVRPFRTDIDPSDLADELTLEIDKYGKDGTRP